MRYFGGKQRTAKRIVEYLDSVGKDLPYFEPFVGSAAIMSLISSERERESRL